MVRKQNTEYETIGREHAEKSLAKANNFCSKLTNIFCLNSLTIVTRENFWNFERISQIFVEVKIRILQALKKDPESVIFSDFFFFFNSIIFSSDISKLVYVHYFLSSLLL